MRAISYSIIIGLLLTMPYFLVHQELPAVLLQGAAMITGLHFIALIIVHFAQQHKRKTISFYPALTGCNLSVPKAKRQVQDAHLKT